MDRIPKSGSTYKRDHGSPEDSDPYTSFQKSHKRVAGHTIAPVKRAVAKLLDQLSKTKEKVRFLKKLRQKRIAKSSIADERDGNDISDAIDINTPAKDNPDASSLNQHVHSDEPLTRHHNQRSDVDDALSKAAGVSSLSKALGKGLQGLSHKASSKPTHNHSNVPGSTHNHAPVDFFGKAAAAGQTVNEIAGALSAFQQAYESENSLKKTDRKALDLLDSITVEDLMAERNSRLTERRPITRKELEKYIETTLTKKAKKQTITAGIAGTFTVAGFIGAGAFAFFPLLPAAAVAMGIGLAATALFSRINQKRAKKKIKRFFFQLANKPILSAVNQSLAEKVKALNEELAARPIKPLIDLDIDTNIDYKDVADKSIFSLKHASGFLGMGARFISALGHAAAGIRTFTSFVSTIFTGITNYKERQKKLKNLDKAMIESMIPNIMGRKFPYTKSPLFKRFVLHNKKTIAKSLGFQRLVSNQVLLQRLDNPTYRELKNKLQNECIKRLLKEQFCRQIGLNIRLFDKLSEADFNKKYSKYFQQFITNKVAGNAFYDTLKAGVTGIMTLSTGFLSLSFFPILIPFTVPAALATLTVGTGVVLLTANHEKGKFKTAMTKVIESGSPDTAADTYQTFRKLILEKMTT